MRNRGISRIAGRRLGAGAGGGLPPGDPNTILTITDDGGIALATTEGPHGLTSGQNVNIADTSEAGYNGGPYEVTVISDTTFYFSVPYIADSTGGTWSLA